MIDPLPDDLKGLYVATLRRDEAAIKALADLLADRGANAIASVLGAMVSFPSSVVAKTTLASLVVSLERPVPVRVRKAIRHLFPSDPAPRGIDPTATLADLCQKTADDFLELRDFGMTSLNLLRDILLDFGLCLRGDERFLPFSRIGDSPPRADA